MKCLNSCPDSPDYNLSSLLEYQVTLLHHFTSNLVGSPKAFFQGEVCERDPPTWKMVQRSSTLGTFVSNVLSYIPAFSRVGNPCNSMTPNGGLWLAHPTPGGQALLRTWALVSFLYISIIPSHFSSCFVRA